MQITGLRIMLGLPHNEGRLWLNTVAAWRFKRKSPSWARKSGEYLYGHSRCSARNVADRFAGNAFRKHLAVPQPWNGRFGWLKYAWVIARTAVGSHDAKIKKTWHERAGAEWYYRYEKQYD